MFHCYLNQTQLSCAFLWKTKSFKHEVLPPAHVLIHGGGIWDRRQGRCPNTLVSSWNTLRAAPAGPHVIPVFEMASQIRRAKFQSKLALAYKCRVGRGSVGTCVAMTFEVQQFTQFRMLSNGTAYCIQYKTCPSVCIYKCIMFHKNNDKGARW
jgi:hypothetical protein